MLKNLDKCLTFNNLEVQHFRLQDMKTKPLIQLREIISKALSDQTNISKSFQSFFIEAMELFLLYQIASTSFRWGGSDARPNSGSV